MKRPLSILQYITPSGVGGAELHVATLAERLRARGHRVTVICPRGRPLTAELAARGLPLYTPRTRGKFDPGMVWRLVGWIRRDRIDLLHTHLSTASLLGSWAARLAGIPSLATVHGLNSPTCFRWARRVIAVSTAVKQHLVDRGVAAARIAVVYNGVEVRASPPEGIRAGVSTRWNLPEAAPLLVTVGRLAPEKGHRYLLEALAQLARSEEWQALRLLVVGAGGQLAALQAQAAQLHLTPRVAFTGFQADVIPLVQAAEVFVLPSLREGLSLSALEAMALGRPVVACRVGGTPEVVVEGETGLLVPPGDPAALAAALARLLRDPDLARRMGEAGARRAREVFGLERMVSELEEIYYELLHSTERSQLR